MRNVSYISSKNKKPKTQNAHKLPGSSRNLAAGLLTDHAMRKRPFHTFEVFSLTIQVTALDSAG